MFSVYLPSHIQSPGCQLFGKTWWFENTDIWALWSTRKTTVWQASRSGYSWKNKKMQGSIISAPLHHSSRAVRVHHGLKRCVMAEKQCYDHFCDIIKEEEKKHKFEEKVLIRVLKKSISHFGLNWRFAKISVVQSKHNGWYSRRVTDFSEWLKNFRARIKDLEGQGHLQKGHFRLGRELWPSKRAPRPSKKRHKGQKKGSKSKGGGGGGGGTPTHFCFRLPKKINTKKQQKKCWQTRHWDSSAHSVALQCNVHVYMQCAVILTLAWNYIDQ